MRSVLKILAGSIALGVCVLFPILFFVPFMKDDFFN